MESIQGNNLLDTQFPALEDSSINSIFSIAWQNGSKSVTYS